MVLAQSEHRRTHLGERDRVKVRALSNNQENLKVRRKLKIPVLWLGWRADLDWWW